MPRACVAMLLVCCGYSPERIAKSKPTESVLYDLYDVMQNAFESNELPRHSDLVALKELTKADLVRTRKDINFTMTKV